MNSSSSYSSTSSVFSTSTALFSVDSSYGENKCVQSLSSHAHATSSSSHPSPNSPFSLTTSCPPHEMASPHVPSADRIIIHRCRSPKMGPLARPPIPPRQTQSSSPSSVSAQNSAPTWSREGSTCTSSSATKSSVADRVVSRPGPCDIGLNISNVYPSQHSASFATGCTCVGQSMVEPSLPRLAVPLKKYFQMWRCYAREKRLGRLVEAHPNVQWERAREGNPEAVGRPQEIPLPRVEPQRWYVVRRPTTLVEYMYDFSNFPACEGETTLKNCSRNNAKGLSKESEKHLQPVAKKPISKKIHFDALDAHEAIAHYYRHFPEACASTTNRALSARLMARLLCHGLPPHSAPEE